LYLFLLFFFEEMETEIAAVVADIADAVLAPVAAIVVAVVFLFLVIQNESDVC
jgi:hypothetical protein